MIRRYTAIAVMLSTLSFAVTSQAQNAAVVNGTKIPDAWVDTLEKNTPNAAGNPAIRAQIKDYLVRMELLSQEAARRKLTNKPEVKMGIQMQTFQVLASALLADELKTSPITDAEIQATYDSEVKAHAGKEYHAHHILVEKEEDAKDIITRLQAGEKFEDLAKAKSKDPGSAEKGGDLDWATPDAYVKPFSDALTGLKKGDITKVPVKTQFGYHIIRLDDTRDSTPPTLEQVKPQIQKMLEQKRGEALVEKLKAKAVIK